MDRILGALLLIGGGMLTLGLEYLPGLLNRESPPMEPVYSMPESVEPVFVTNQSTPVAGTGKRDAPDYFFVCEYPATGADACGGIFARADFDLLCNMLKAMGTDAESVFITAAIKCRPSGKAAADSATPCVKWLMKQVAETKPKCIVAMGDYALRLLAASDALLTPPLTTTGIFDRATTSARIGMSTGPPCPADAKRPCTVIAPAPASSTARWMSKITMLLGFGPMRVFTVTGRPDASRIFATISPIFSGARINAAPAPHFSTFGTGHPALMFSEANPPNFAAIRAASAISLASSP